MLMPTSVRPDVLVLDVYATLSELEPLRAGFEQGSASRSPRRTPTRCSATSPRTRAGLSGIWVDRCKTKYPKSFLPPDLQVPKFDPLADELA
jgi:hypothetical protein